MSEFIPPSAQFYWGLLIDITNGALVAQKTVCGCHLLWEQSTCPLGLMTRDKIIFFFPSNPLGSLPHPDPILCFCAAHFAMAVYYGRGKDRIGL